MTMNDDAGLHPLRSGSLKVSFANRHGRQKTVPAHTIPCHFYFSSLEVEV